MAGLARAKAEGTRLRRPATVTDDQAKVLAIRAARAAGKSIRAIALEHGVGIGEGLAPGRIVMRLAALRCLRVEGRSAAPYLVTRAEGGSDDVCRT